MKGATVGDESEVGSGKGIIPNFFYDVISFIIPGSCLLIGGFLIWFGQDWSKALFCWLTAGGRQEGSIAAISVLFGICFILFLGISSFLGFLLSTLSYQIVERPFRKFSPCSMDKLREFAGSGDDEAKLKRSFAAKFGKDLEKCNIDRASNICAYYIWKNSSVLGTLSGRFDAEKIMAQSSILVSFLLLAVDICAAAFGRLSHFTFFTWLVCLLLCLIASSFAFCFHRQKRVYGRFQIFLALTAEDTAPIAPSSMT